MQERKKDGKFDKKQRDIFLLWGEYPKGWAMVKDLVLCVFLINTFIASAQQVDIAALMAPETKEYVNNTIIHKAEAKEVVKEEKQQEGAKTIVQEVAKKVYVLESSGGKNDSCKNDGKVNGYGYGWYDGKRPCYETHEQVTALVEKWFTDQLKTKDLATALCGYNLGFKSENFEKCLNQSDEYPYYRDYLRI